MLPRGNRHAGVHALQMTKGEEGIDRADEQLEPEPMGIPGLLTQRRLNGQHVLKRAVWLLGVASGTPMLECHRCRQNTGRDRRMRHRERARPRSGLWRYGLGAGPGWA